MSTSAKKASDYIPFFADQRLEYGVGAPDENKNILAGQVTLVAGAASVDLVDLFGTRMKDTSYQVLLTTDGAVAAWAAKTVSGFDISGTGTDVVDFLVIGQLEGQP